MILSALVLAIATDAAALQRKAARFAPTEVSAPLVGLPAGERAALARIVEAARLMDTLYLRQVWSGNEPLLLLLRERRGLDGAGLVDRADHRALRGLHRHPDARADAIMALQATGDADRARELLQRMGVVRPEVNACWTGSPRCRWTSSRASPRPIG